MPKPTPLSPALQEKILDLAHAYGLTALEIAPRFRVPYAAVNALLGAERARVAELARIKARADAWAAGTWPPDSDSSARLRPMAIGAADRDRAARRRQCPRHGGT